MSSIFVCIDSYNAGLAAYKKRDYLRAAREFYICTNHLSEGEFPFYDRELEKMAGDAIKRYDRCLKRMNKKDRATFQNNLNAIHCLSWREECIFLSRRINEDREQQKKNHNTKQKWFIGRKLKELISCL